MRKYDQSSLVPARLTEGRTNFCPLSEVSEDAAEGAEVVVGDGEWTPAKWICIICAMSASDTAGEVHVQSGKGHFCGAIPVDGGDR